MGLKSSFFKVSTEAGELRREVGIGAWLDCRDKTYLLTISVVPSLNCHEISGF